MAAASRQRRDTDPKVLQLQVKKEDLASVSVQQASRAWTEVHAKSNPSLQKAMEDALAVKMAEFATQALFSRPEEE